jgi:putative ABC transport system permease protein
LRAVSSARNLTSLLASFAAVALLLAALGIYGVLAYAVARRTREIGIRMALGARPGDVLLAIAGQGMAWSAVGIFIGAAGGLALTRMLSKMLFEVSPTEPATFGAAAALLLAVAWTASHIPRAAPWSWIPSWLCGKSEGLTVNYEHDA